jgi:hypothetical protein
MTEIEVQNKINFKNIAAFFVIGFIGIINGFKDFSMYQKDIAKIIFPDPVVYQSVVVMNNTMMSSLSLQNSMSFGGLVFTILAVVVIAVVVFGMMCGTLGMSD